MIVLNSAEMRKSLVGTVRTVRLYSGPDSREPLAELEAEIKTENWMNSGARENIIARREALRKRANAATGYDAKTIADLLATIALDIERVKDDLTVYTPRLVTEIVDPDAQELAQLRYYRDCVVEEAEIAVASGIVPLMEHNLPINETVKLAVKAFGDKTTLRELVLNPFYKTEIVIRSAAKALADGENGDFFRPLNSAVFDAAHSQKFDETGATRDLQKYNTIRDAIDKAVRLYDVQSGKQNGLMEHEIYILVNPLDALTLEPIINGALARVAGVAQTADKLPVAAMIPYGGGLNNGQTWGGKTISYPGVKPNEFYILVKNRDNGGYKIIKRTPTMEMGEGDVLGLTTEKRAWHRIDGMFLKWLLPSTIDGKACGRIVKGSLIEDEE
ncbi:MAG: hypothetical protein LBC53_09535 [Spirochaetaceae bacterium]|jgi:hypothetical protein|nr:hypothetical protein [Spirochaetaceae bacterium]